MEELKKYMNHQYFIPAVVSVVVVVVALGAYFIFNKPASVPNTPQAAQEEVQKIVAEVGKLMALPAETPTVATVSDITKLKDQPFFQNAKNGDKVLIYGTAKQAILYDPNAKKVLNVAPINVGSQSAQTASPDPAEAASSSAKGAK